MKSLVYLTSIVLSACLIFAGQAVQAEKKKQKYRPVASAYYPLQVRYYGNLVAKGDRKMGGAIDRAGDNYIAVTGTGALYQVYYSSKEKSFLTRKLSISVPINFKAFDAAADPRVDRDHFRTIDIVSHKVLNGWQLFVSHHYWKEKEQCAVLRVSAIVTDPKFNNGVWETVFDTSPCLKLTDNQRGKIFPGNEAGGRMAWLSDQKLLLTVGDLQMDGWNNPEVAAQKDDYLYGKTLAIDIKTKQVEIFSIGHRNPQGLYIDSKNNIWLTEHGPRGGDEVNLVIKGKNYGWPYQTYGTEYGEFSWPMEKSGESGNYEPPVYSWTPSIGVSNLMRVDNRKFPAWNGNLLVTSLVGKTLYRLQLSNERVVLVEPILIGRPIRDVISGPDGDIWLWGQEGDMVTITVDEHQEEGERLFQTTCASCHPTGANSGSMAPTLKDIVGRPIASRKDFNYSENIRKLSGEWTKDKLDKFLENPGALVPDTAMSDVQVKEPEARIRIIEYLENLP